jgi:hypothetical protein
MGAAGARRAGGRGQHLHGVLARVEPPLHDLDALLKQRAPGLGGSAAWSSQK